MDCRSVSRLLSDQRLDELPREQQEAVAEHVWQCAACRRTWGLDASVGSRGGQGTAASGSALPSRDEGDAPPLGSVEEPWPPRDLGGFEILGLLGWGGVGIVYRARQPSVDRTVALKVLSSRAAWDAASVARFTREARAAGAVGHPNIVQVYDIGKDRGWHYIAMEYVDGGSLSDAIRQEGPLVPSDALAMMRQMAAALAETHRIRILHRDIKPSNILLTSKGWAKLADFGLAKRPAVDLTVTGPVPVLGTPMYMAPEVLRGEEFGPCSDLYSLGATFYHAIAGRPPFEAATSAEIAVKQLTSSPAPLGAIAPGTPPSLVRIIHKLLDKAPTGRYSCAEDLLEALDAADLPRACPAATGPGRLRRLVRRRPRTALAAALIVLAAIGALAAVLAWPAARPVVLFGGATLDGWEAVSSFPDHGPPGPVQLRDGQIILGAGSPDTGIAWAGEFPTTNYVVTIEAKRLAGSGDFCSVTFPAGESRCTLLVGAASDLVRLKRVDGEYVDGSPPPGGLSEERWYRVRLRVTPSLLEAWIDDHKAIALQTTGRELTAMPSYDRVKPFGITSWETTAAIRRVELRRFPPERR